MFIFHVPKEFGNRFLRDMSFYLHFSESFQAQSESYNDFFKNFLSPSSFFMAFRSIFFEILKKLWGISEMESLYFVTLQVSGIETFCGEVFLGILRTNNRFFSLNFSAFQHLFLFEAIYCSLELCERLLLILKYYIKNLNFVKNKSLCYYFSWIFTNFKTIGWDPLVKVDTCKETSLNSFAKINERLVI